MKLTAKQQEVLGALREYMDGKRENPTSYKLHKYLSARGAAGEMKSLMQVVEALEKKELIRRDGERRIFLVENDAYGEVENVWAIPLYGLASCGEALAYADETADDFLQISKSLFYRADPKQLFAVKALGDSMNRDNINDGDYVIFEKVKEGVELEGKIVVAVINGMATIKRYRKVERGVIGLYPHSTNDAHHPIFLSDSDSVFIAGMFQKVLPVTFVTL
ncbi:MAG TPA: S24 family peptidase [Candidatus Moranbacteria bacterium]|nr:S24 family peptidase [Candidatus Moranbacteria bacterium]